MHPQPEKLITTKELATFVGLSTSFFEKARCYGGGPKFIRLGGRVRYRWSDVKAWIEEGNHSLGGGVQ